MALSILKDLGYGKSIVETRISVELEQLVERIRQSNGLPIDPSNALHQCIGGVMLGFLFGRHFDHETDPLTLQLDKLIAMSVAALNNGVDIFPMLRFLPRNAKIIRTYVNENR
jgi:cytochrome P450 family 2 subfamily B